MKDEVFPENALLVLETQDGQTIKEPLMTLSELRFFLCGPLHKQFLDLIDEKKKT